MVWVYKFLQNPKVIYFITYIKGSFKVSFTRILLEKFVMLLVCVIRDARGGENYTDIFTKCYYNAVGIVIIYKGK